MLPPFTDHGILPPGDYPLTLDELAESMLVHGNSTSVTWDWKWRLELAENLAILVDQLSDVGITEIFIDGSFVTDKDHPNDIDGYFECDLQRLSSGELERELNLLDEHKIWTWDPSNRRRFYPRSSKKQLPMWHQYRVELYPHCGQASGITDTFGNQLQFPAAFRLSREGTPRGIIKIEWR